MVKPNRPEDAETEGIGAALDDTTLSLAIVQGDVLSTHPLPPGDVVIGRGTDATIRIDDTSISRRHAVIHTGPPTCIEDCGSANGTRVGEVLLTQGQMAELRVGTVLELGRVRAFVQRGRVARKPAARRAPSKDGEIGELARLRALVDRIAVGTIPVLIVGETGAGKEVMAEEIHRASNRAKEPFIRLNCAGFTEALLQSELFGHERGAFTGAHQAKAGLLETANGGSVFLDEVGELPLTMQAKLLRVFEERAVMRVGAIKSRPIDVRFIAATNRDLETEVAAGRFRQDLFFRLNGVLIEVRPLRQRVEEIEVLAQKFILEAAERGGRPAPMLSTDALALLRSHSWPGNVRELRHMIDRAVLLSTGDRILPEHLPTNRLPGVRPQSGTPSHSIQAPPFTSPLSVKEPPPPLPLRDEIASVERDRLLDALARCAGNQTQAAKMLGIARGTLIARLAAFDIPRPRKR
jgi:transcriptional regulator with PAS, ATPase and Fis domain